MFVFFPGCQELIGRMTITCLASLQASPMSLWNPRVGQHCIGLQLCQPVLVSGTVGPRTAFKHPASGVREVELGTPLRTAFLPCPWIWSQSGGWEKVLCLSSTLAHALALWGACRDVQLRLEPQVPPLLHQEACLQEADGSGQGTGAATEVSEDMSKISVYF